MILNGTAAVEQWVNYQTRQNNHEPVPYGIQVLDRSVGYHMPGTMEVVGARTNVGKSFILLEQARNQARAGARPLYISGEDPIEEVGKRLTNIPHDEARGIELAFPYRGVLSEILSLIADGVRRGVTNVLIDYLQVFRYDGELPVFSRHDSLTNIMRETLAVCKELMLPLTWASQIRRPGPDGVDKPPTMYDLKESGDIENLAHCILLAHRTSPTSLRLWVEKNKSGPVGASMTYLRGDGGLLTPDDGLLA